MCTTRGLQVHTIIMTTTRNQSKTNRQNRDAKSNAEKQESNLKNNNGNCDVCKGNLGDLDVYVGSKFELTCVCCRRFLLIKKNVQRNYTKVQ